MYISETSEVIYTLAVLKSPESSLTFNVFKSKPSLAFKFETS